MYWNVNNIWKLAVGLLILTTIYYIIIGTTLPKDRFKTAAYVGLILAIPTAILAIHQGMKYIPMAISYLVLKRENEQRQPTNIKHKNDYEIDVRNENDYEISEQELQEIAVRDENERRRLANIQQNYDGFLSDNIYGISKQELKEITDTAWEQETGVYENDGISSVIPGWTKKDAAKISNEFAERERKNKEAFDKFIADAQEKERQDKRENDKKYGPVKAAEGEIAYYKEQADDINNSDGDREEARTTMYKIIDAVRNYKDKHRIL